MMATLDTERLGESRLGATYIYAIAVLASATGAIFATYRLVFDQIPPHVIVLGAFVLIVGAPIMGYNGNSFLAGVLTGVLPAAGYTASIWAWPPFDAARLEGMVAGALWGTMWGLPLASFLFIVGVGLRRDGTFTEKKRALVLRVAAAILITVAIGVALDMRLLRVHGDQ